MGQSSSYLLFGTKGANLPNAIGVQHRSLAEGLEKDLTSS